MSNEIPTSPGGFSAGSQIAGYQLEEQIGRGGMAVVFRAHDPRLGRRVALKILAPELARDDAFRQRFIRESRAAAAVDHPHIIPVFEAGEAEGVLFIAMRYVVGRDVRTLLDEHGPLAAARVAVIVTQVASALDAAHTAGLIHRDVKPANMLLDAAAGSGRPDHIYLSDFGLSKRSVSSSGLTGTGQFLGTLDYVAPEQIEGKAVEGAADQYALAGAAFEMLGGQPPFRRDQGLAVLWAQISETPPPLTSLRPDLPPAVDGVMAKALAKAPADRFGSCLEFAAALRAACGLRPEESTDPGGWATPAPGTGGPRPRQATELASSNPPMPGTAPPGWPPPGTAAADLPVTPAPYPAGSGAAAGGPPTMGPTGPATMGPSGQVPGPVLPGPPTEAVRISGPGSTRGGLTEPPPPSDYGLSPAYGPPAGYSGAGVANPPWWRSRFAVVAAAVIIVIVGAAGGYKLISGHSNANNGNAGGGGGGGNPPAAGPTIPGCITTSAKTKVVHNVAQAHVDIGGNPFAVQVAPDGQHVFVTRRNTLSVLEITGALAPRLTHQVAMPGASKGDAITKDGKYLIVATGGGGKVYSVADAINGTATSVGTLSTPAGRGAVQVALSPEGNFAFISLQSSGGVAVFNLKKAFASNFASDSLVGIIPTGSEPVGVTPSPDGNTLYVTSIQKVSSPQPSQGELSIVDLHKAETDPATSVLHTTPAGCSPVRAITSADGSEVWVTARESDALLGFSAEDLRTNPGHALNARVDIGAGPIGVTYAAHMTRLVVAASDLNHNLGGKPSLSIVDPAKAIAGKPAFVGQINTGGLPRQFTVEGNTLLVTNYGAGQLLALNIPDLP